MQFRVLGPLEVDVGEGPVPLGGPKQRAVLGNLLVRANQIVPVDVLIDEVWGEDAPEQARNTLQTYVSNLRRAIGEDRVVGRTPGYVVVVEPTELDAARFDQLLRAARVALPVDPATAVATIEDALALWRGPALADLSGRPGLLAEAARLDELRLDAQAIRLEALVAVGENVRAIAELDTLLAREPLRENFWALQMLALYREGRQAEALDAYRTARGILHDELGVEPSRELAGLHERVLRHDPGLDLAGEPLRGYRLLEKVAEGPDATVFRAVQPYVGRDVTIKVFREEVTADRTFVHRFDQDAKRVVAVEHPNLATTYDAWREPGRAYVVSRYLRGGTLRERLEQGRPEPPESARILDAVASALAAAHRLGVPHGHVCETNVLFDAEGTVLVTDLLIRRRSTADIAQDVRELAGLARALGAHRLAAVDRLLALVDAGDPDVDALAFAQAARTGLDPQAAEASAAEDARNPYKGLRAFTETDAGDFFGRAGFVAQLIVRLEEPAWGSRFLALVGPSGCGKSSIVRAGLVPALRRGVVQGQAERYVAEMVPGEHPLDELEAALSRAAVRNRPRLHELTDAGSRGLLGVVERILPDDAELVLVVDQLEELYTLTADRVERERFLDLLRVASVDVDSRVRVVATLRADFYDRPLAAGRFGELLAARSVPVPPLAPDEIELAIRRPAEHVGVVADPDLEALMIADVTDQPGALPLLQFALTEVFEARDGHHLSVAAYESIGGISGAVSSVAEDLADSPEPGWTEAVRQVFLRLVTLGEGARDTRRRASRLELDHLEVDPRLVERVLAAYGGQRLLTFDHEPGTRQPTVEIAHESLLQTWGRLAGWIDAARDDLRRERALSRAGAEWRASGRDDSFLLSGSRLDQEATWVGEATVTVGHDERAFLKASLDRRDEQRRRDLARAEREARTERRSRTRLRALVGVFAVAALVAASLTIVATAQKERADDAARAASARALAAAAAANLELDPERSVLLALASVDTARSAGGEVLPEAEDALHRAVAASRTVLSVPGVGGDVAWSPTGQFAAVSATDPGTVIVGDADTGRTRASWHLHEAPVTALAFDATGTWLASTSEDGLLQVVDVGTGRRVVSVRGSGRATQPTFADEGQLVSAAWPDEGLARVVRTTDGRAPMRIRLSPETDRVALRPDGRAIGIASDSGEIVVLALPSQRELRRMRVQVDGSFSLSWSPDGRLVAAGTIAGGEVWEASTGDRLARLPGHPWIDALAWGPDSRTLATGGPDASGIRVWSVGEDTVSQVASLSSVGVSRGIGGLAMSPDGSRVMAGAEDRTRLWVWDLTRGGTAERGAVDTVSGFGDVAFLPDGRLMAADPAGRFRIHDLTTGTRSAPIGPPVVLPWGEHQFALSSDGRLLVVPGPVSAWDTATGRTVFASSVNGDLDGVIWDAGGTLLALVDGEKHATVLLDRSGRQVASLPDQGPGGTRQARFSPDGSLLATIGGFEGSGSLITIWDLRSERVLRTMRTEEAGGVVFDASGTRVVTLLGAAAVWDVATGRRLGTLDPAALFVAVGPDGRFIAVGGPDGTIQLFDGRTMAARYVLQTNDPWPVGRLTFNADGSRLAAQSLSGQGGPGVIRVWAMDVDELVGIARAELTRTFTDEECAQYQPPTGCPQGRTPSVGR